MVACDRLAAKVTVAVLSAAAYFSREVGAMRFWIGLLLGLLIGASATVAYYEFWDPGADEITESEDI